MALQISPLRSFALALAVSGAIATSGAALAQEADMGAGAEVAPAPMEPAAPAASDFDTAQLEAFAVAYVDVTEIAMSYEQQMTDAQSDEDLIALQTQAQEEMIAAVDAVEGLTVEEYSLIFQAVQTDPELGAQVQGLIEEQMQ